MSAVERLENASSGASSGSEESDTDSQKKRRMEQGASQEAKQLRKNAEDIENPATEVAKAKAPKAPKAPKAVSAPVMEPMEHIVDARNDPRGVYQVQKNVKLLMSSWGAIKPVQPDYFLQRMLESRGYDSSHINAPAIR
jgi:hypothetical protein